MTANGSPLTVGHVARRLGISEQHVRRLDGELQPERTAGGVRLYDPARVEQLADERAQRSKR